MSLRPFSNEQKRAVVAQVVSLAEGWEQIEANLAGRGFCAWRANTEFLESFCAEGTKTEYRRYRVENAKERFGRVGNVQSFYVSAYLQELRAERDEVNQMSAYDAERRLPPWCSEVSPCDQARVRLECEDREQYAVRDAAWRKKMERIQASEVKRHVGRASGHGLPLAPEARLEVYCELMDELFRPMGFVLDHRRSYLPEQPVFSRTLCFGWSLSWAPPEDQFWFWQERGILVPRLCLVPGAVKRVRADSGEAVLWLPYQELVPGFSWPYGLFTSLAQLELLLRAHAALYEILAVELEARITNALATA